MRLAGLIVHTGFIAVVSVDGILGVPATQPSAKADPKNINFCSLPTETSYPEYK